MAGYCGDHYSRLVEMVKGKWLRVMVLRWFAALPPQGRAAKHMGLVRVLPW